MLRFIVHLPKKMNAAAKSYRPFLLGAIVGIVAGVGATLLVINFSSEKESNKTNEVSMVEPASQRAESPNVKSQSPAPKPEKVESVQEESYETDSLAVDSLDISEDILVRKDELIRTVVLKLAKPASDTVNQKNALDSLAEDIKIRETEFESYNLELWLSPVGFKGYKFSGNNIIIYGLDTIRKFAIQRKDEMLFLSADGMMIPLIEGEDFRPITFRAS